MAQVCDSFVHYRLSTSSSLLRNNARFLPFTKWPLMTVHLIKGPRLAGLDAEGARRASISETAASREDC